MTEPEFPQERLERILASPELAIPEEQLPKTLWHYTSATAATAIAASRNLRATNVSFLNDPSEVEYARQTIQSQVQSIARNIEPRVAHVLELASRMMASELESEIYVTCFTSLGDDLSQWRAYGNSTIERYSLGFNPRVLQRRTRDFGAAAFGPIKYLEPAQREEVNDILNVAIEFLRTENWDKKADEERVARVLGQRLARLAPFFKNPAYRVESEWRIVIWRYHWRVEQEHAVAFDASRGVVRPYVAFPIGRRLTLNDLIVLAPARPALALKAAKMLMRDIGNSQAVPRYSTIPFAD